MNRFKPEETPESFEEIIKELVNEKYEGKELAIGPEAVVKADSQ